MYELRAKQKNIAMDINNIQTSIWFITKYFHAGIFITVCEIFFFFLCEINQKKVHWLDSVW